MEGTRTRLAIVRKMMHKRPSTQKANDNIYYIDEKRGAAIDAFDKNSELFKAVCLLEQVLMDLKDKKSVTVKTAMQIIEFMNTLPTKPEKSDDAK